MDIRNHVYNFSVEPKATGRHIKELRKAKGMTAQDLADALVCSVKTISSWETGARFPSLDNLVDLANFFEVTVHSLMLPDDNCEVEPQLLFPFIGFRDVYWRWRNDEDKELAKLFTRREYLFQRLSEGVYTRANCRELEYIESQLNSFWCDEMTVKELEMISQQDKLSAYFDFIKRKSDLNIIYKIIFNRLWYDQELSNTLKSLDSFSRDIIFTASLYSETSRNKDYTKLLFDYGARLIDIKYHKIKKSINDAQKNHEQVSIICKKLVKWNIFSEEDMEGYLGIPSNDGPLRKLGLELSYKDGSLPRYSENPEFYDGHEESKIIDTEETDESVRKNVAACYFIMDFIDESIKTYEQYKDMSVQCDNLKYDEYVKKLIDGGYLPI